MKEIICEKEKCTGCFACYNICPKEAIKMEEDSHGFIYPKIEKEKCVGCELCKKVCPYNNPVELQSPKHCYAAALIDSKKLDESTSGGMATAFSEYILEKGGVVYGASFSNEKDVKHIKIENKSDLEKIKGSKYVHSYINDIYKSVKFELQKERYVLFTGTPCQVAGLKNFLNKEFDKLFCVDIICHGVPSQKYLKDELKNVRNIDKISFRSKEGFYLKGFLDNNEIYCKKMEDSAYYSGFLTSTFYRLNCYDCKYAKKERVSDVTIGDFWGLDKKSKIYNKSDNGISVVLTQTPKGEELFEKVKSTIYFEERTIDEAIKGNTQLREPSKMKKEYYKFKKYYEKFGLEDAYKKSDRLRVIKRKIRYYLRDNKKIYDFYMKLKRN